MVHQYRQIDRRNRPSFCAKKTRFLVIQTSGDFEHGVTRGSLLLGSFHGLDRYAQRSLRPSQEGPRARPAPRCPAAELHSNVAYLSAHALLALLVLRP